MTSSASIRQARELYELKERAAKYYAENGVPQKMEEIMNDMFYDNPLDVYGHLVSLTHTLRNCSSNWSLIQHEDIVITSIRLALSILALH